MILVVGILGIIILFLNKGYIRKRNKELAILYALGRSKKDVIVIILLEHLLISTISFIIGYLCLWMIKNGLFEIYFNIQFFIIDV